MSQSDDRFEAWFRALESRHLARLTFAEVRRGLQALSALYVTRRERLSAGAALDGAGKRAAFALFYSPLHFLLVREVVRALGAAHPAPRVILDLGCGTGASGAAWALEAGARCRIAGVDRNRWAVEEARWNYAALGLPGRPRWGAIGDASLTGDEGGILAAFTINELAARERDVLLERLLGAIRRGASVLVVEPIARRPSPWWDGWSSAFAAAGGRDDSWRFAIELPPGIRLLDQAARLDHRELTGRSLWIAGGAR